MTKQKEQALVVSQEQLADGIFSMWIQTKAADTAKPGQFISMYTNDGSKLLPRPISICEIDAVNGRLRVVYRVTGENTGTEQFSSWKREIQFLLSDLWEMGSLMRRQPARKYFLWVEESEFHRSLNLQNRWNVRKNRLL